jgi:hypothetical protein
MASVEKNSRYTTFHVTYLGKRTRKNIHIENVWLNFILFHISADESSYHITYNLASKLQITVLLVFTYDQELVTVAHSHFT